MRRECKVCRGWAGKFVCARARAHARTCTLSNNGYLRTIPTDRLEQLTARTRLVAIHGLSVRAFTFLLLRPRDWLVRHVDRAVGRGHCVPATLGAQGNVLGVGVRFVSTADLASLWQ